MEKLEELLTILRETQENVDELRGNEVSKFCEECILLVEEALKQLRGEKQ